MMFLLLLIAFLLTSVLGNTSLDVACGHLVSTGQTVKTWATELSLKDTGDLIPNGEVLCARALVEYSETSREATEVLAAEARLALRAAEREEQELLEKIRKSSSSTKKEDNVQTQISPALEWAQSAARIFLRIKWAHKIDAPATLDVGEPVITCKDKQLSVIASSSRKVFTLDLKTYAQISDSCSWESGAVGRITLTIEKLYPDVWPKLGTSSSPIHLWFDKQEDFTDELDKLVAANKNKTKADIDHSKKKVDSKKAKKKEGRDSKSKESHQSTSKSTQKDGVLSTFHFSKNVQIIADSIVDKLTDNLIEPISATWSRLATNSTSGALLLDLGHVILNAFDGWTGDPRDFLHRQAERAQARALRNATRLVEHLHAELTLKKHKINHDLRLQIAALSVNSTSSNSSSVNDTLVLADDEDDDNQIK